MTKRKTRAYSTTPPWESTNRRTLCRAERLVRGLNDLSPDVFRSKYIPDDQLKTFVPGRDGHSIGPINIHLTYAGDMLEQDLQNCFSLVEATSRHDYERSSFGWRPKRKLREMRESDMKYLLLYREDKSLVGFLSFMATRDSIPTVPVLYIYEIHLEANIRGSGIGKHLLALVETIGSQAGLQKVMLTCFRRNERAYRFYESAGYSKDAISPEDRETRNKVVPADYWILSKELESRICDRHIKQAT